MKVSGFTFVRNGVKYDYPVVEAIQSILPICDEFIVAVGDSDDGTLELIQSIQSDKIKIINTVWDLSLTKDLKILAVETDKAFDAIAPDSDWAFYMQADEVVHEKYLDNIKEAMQRYKDNPEVEGLLFNYTHFYGNYKYVANSRKWYRKEIRIIRNDKRIRSYRDAQGFRKDGRKLNVKEIDAHIYHYGWVRNPYYIYCRHHDDNGQANLPSLAEKKVVKQDELYDYNNIDSLTFFNETHPKVMQKRINSMDWDFEFDINKRNLSLKNRILQWIEKWTGKRFFEYRNYEILK